MSALSDTFHPRLQRLYKQLVANGNLDAVLVATGIVDANEDAGYLKSLALTTWLFGSELQGFAIAVTKDVVTIAFAPNDVAAFRPLAGAVPGDGGCPDVRILDSTKEDADLEAALKAAVAAGDNVGALIKEAKNQAGPVAALVRDVAETAKEKINLAPLLAVLLAVKDADEIAKVRKAATLSAAVFRYALVERIETTIDKGKMVPHTVLSDLAEDAILNPTKVKIKGFRAESCDPCYPPIVQSAAKDSKGRSFDLRPSAESDENPLHFGCIIASLGARYSYFCSNISRTLLVDPSDDQKAAYEALVKAQQAAIDALTPGAKLNAAYQAAVTSLKKSNAKHADMLVAGIGKNVGFGIGIEYRDSHHILNAKNEIVVVKDMIFNVAVGCSDLNDDVNGSYALFVADTVHVRGGELLPDVFTASSRKDLRHIMYEIGGEDEDDVAGSKPIASAPKKSGSGGGDDDIQVIDATSRRGRRGGGAGNSADVDDGDGDGGKGSAEEERRRRHQAELEQRMLDRGRKFLEGGVTQPGEQDPASHKKVLDKIVAYRSSAHFPMTRSRQLAVDMEAEAVLVPINGIPVPFHISTIKNASKSDEGKHTYLRINFHVPVSAVARSNFSRVAQNAPTFPELEKRGAMTTAFVKELSFRSSNPQNLSDCMRKIKELVKRASIQQTEAREKGTLVDQEKVRLVKGGRVPFIANATVRPPLAAGKANREGVLEAHANGFYYRGKNGHIEILYANVRNAFFQEADKEVIVCVHFHLKNEIMVGKKKTKDVQFFVEVMESAVRLNDKRRRNFDQDELEEEQRERDKRNKTNKTFLKFTKEVEDRYGLQFDIPYRTLAFTGAPRSAAVTLLPTVNCIIDVIDWPPFVLNLQDVQVAHFERVNLNHTLRNFDLVFVYKNFQADPGNPSKPTKDMWMRISAIETEDLNSIKKYLDEQEIKYYEGPMSLNWNNVLKSIRSDFEAFYEDGGWQFLSADAGDDEDGGVGSGDDSLEGDEEFEVPEDASEEVESSDGSSEYSDDSDDSGDVRDELGGDSDAGEEELDSEDEGLDWDEQERKAKAADMNRVDLSDDEDGKSRRGKRSSSSGVGTTSSKTKKQNGDNGSSNRKRKR
jgi:nucleosome binding factor SPN SPT16 subunit